MLFFCVRRREDARLVWRHGQSSQPTTQPPPFRNELCLYHPRHPILILCAHISPTPTRTTRVLGIGTVFCHPVSGGYNQANERYKPTKFHCAFLLRRLLFSNERQVILEAVAFVAGLRLRISDLFDSCWAYSKFFVIYYCIALTGNDNEDVLQAIVPSPKVR